MRAILKVFRDPEQGIDLGCRVLQRKLAAAGGDVARALLAWNGGANAAYPGAVLARMNRYL